MKPDCKESYEDGIFVDTKKPGFGIFVISDFPKGWIDQVCVVCSNKDEEFTSQTEVH